MLLNLDIKHVFNMSLVGVRLKTNKKKLISQLKIKKKK